MAAQPTDEVIEWHKRLGGDNYDFWISPSVSACFTEEKLKALSDIYSSGNFRNLSEGLKTKLLLALCNIHQRNSDQWRQHIDAIFNVALSESSDSWVRPIADMLHTLPSLGYLRTSLDDNQLFSDALDAIQTRRQWRLNALPMEAEFVNPDVLADLGCPEGHFGTMQQQQQHQQKRHFVIMRKPRSVVAMGVIMEKAKQRDDSQEGGGRRYAAPIKMRSFAKKWYDEEEDDDRQAPSTISHHSSLSSSASSRLPGSQIRRPQLTSSQSQPPLQLLSRQRSTIGQPSTPGGHHHQLQHQQSQSQQQQQQQRTTKLIELSEPPAIGRAAKARRRQEEAERRRQEERETKKLQEEEAAKAKAREAEEAQQRLLVQQAEEEAAAAAAAAAAASAAAAATAAAAAAAATATAPTVQLSNRGAPVSAPPVQAGVAVSMANTGAGFPLAATSHPQPLASHHPTLGPTMASIIPSSTLPSLRLTPAIPSQPQQQSAPVEAPAAPAPAPTPSYLLPFAPAYPGQMQQPALFAYSQPSSAAPSNITVVQLVNRAYAMQPQQQAAALAVQLTPEQSRVATELFATANKLTKPEKSVILAFIGGNRTNLTPELGNLVRIHLSEYKERVFDQNQRVYKDVVADQYFQMDYATGHWTIVKRYKEGAPDVLAKLDYLRPQQPPPPPQQQPQQPQQQQQAQLHNMGGI